MNGGKRPGAGRKKGFRFPKTIEKEEARELLRTMVKAQLGPMVEAQIDNAKGIKYLVARERKTGKFVEVTQEQVKVILSGKDDTFEMLEVREKVPSIQAFTDLMNRTLDKPSEQLNVDMTVHKGLEERIRAARGRVGK